MPFTEPSFRGGSLHFKIMIKEEKSILPLTRRIERGTTGICVEYTIEAISKPQYIHSAQTMGVRNTIEEQIMERLWHYPNGRLNLSFLSAAQDVEPRAYYGITVAYKTSPDYRFLSRIFAWLFNFSPDEALVAADFQRAYGSALGDHIFEKWRGYRMDLTKMIGYFGTDYEKGQKFFSLVMEKVVQYEERINTVRRSREPSFEPYSSISDDGEKEAGREASADACRSEPRGEAGAGACRTGKGNPCGAPAVAGGLDTSGPNAVAAP